MSIPPLVTERGTILAEQINWPIAAVAVTVIVCMTVLVAMRILPIEILTHVLTALAGAGVASSSGLIKRVSTGLTMRPPPPPAGE